MCIAISNDIVSNKPFNESKTRWKVLVDDAGGLSSIHYYSDWKLNKNKKAKDNTWAQNASRKDIGIHVLLTKKDALAAAKYIRNMGRDVDDSAKLVLVAMEVSGFNVAGTWDYTGKALKSETWKTAKPIKVFTESGRYDITNRFA